MKSVHHAIDSFFSLSDAQVGLQNDIGNGEPILPFVGGAKDQEDKQSRSKNRFRGLAVGLLNALDLLFELINGIDHRCDKTADERITYPVYPLVSLHLGGHDSSALQHGQMLRNHRLGLFQTAPQLGHAGFLPHLYGAENLQAQRVTAGLHHGSQFVYFCHNPI
jgi:hypothetical protein